MNASLVSVIMPIKNAERYLADALDSVAAQTYPHYEIIVVDGGSDDRGPTIAAARPQTICIQQTGTGFADAWNCGIRASRAKYIAFLDSDDVWVPGKLDAQIHWFERHESVQYVIGRVQYFVEPGQPVPRGFKPELLNGTHIAYMPGTSMVRRGLFDTVGAFQDHWRIASDIEWFGRLRELKIECGVFDEVVLRKRVHAANLSYVTDWSVYRKELLQLLKTSVDRRRGHGADRPGTE